MCTTMYNRKDYNEGLLLTKQQTERLIELYKADQGLWDLSSPVYHNKDNRRKALQNILDILRQEYDGLDGTVDQLQHKLSNLRGYYSRELGKIRKTQRNPAEQVYVSSWKLFEPLDSFLRAQITPRKQLTNQEAAFKIEPDDYESYEETISEELEEPQNMSFQAKNLPIIHSSYHTPSTESESLDNEIRTENTHRMKRPRFSHSETIVSNSENILIDTGHRTKIQKSGNTVTDTMTKPANIPHDQQQRETSSNVSLEEDEDSLFARYMIAELRKIRDPRTKALVKFKIHSVIFESQFGSLQDNNSSVNQCNH